MAMNKMGANEESTDKPGVRKTILFFLAVILFAIFTPKALDYFDAASAAYYVFFFFWALFYANVVFSILRKPGARYSSKLLLKQAVIICLMLLIFYNVNNFVLPAIGKWSEPTVVADHASDMFWGLSIIGLFFSIVGLCFYFAQKTPESEFIV
jgi:hypothetical protein